MEYKRKPLGIKYHFENVYRITLKTQFGIGTFDAYGVYEEEALDVVADYLVDCEINAYLDHYELYDLCEVGQTVDEYAQANGLTCCGKHGIYVKVLSIEEIKEEN